LELILLLCHNGYTMFKDYKKFIYAEMVGFSEIIEFLDSVKNERDLSGTEISNLNELCDALKKSSTLSELNKLGKSYYDYDGRHISEYHNGLEYGKALFWFKKAADKGCVNSMMDMAQLCGELGHHYGKKTYNVPDKKEQFNSESIFWYAMAADKGNLEAMVKIGQRMDLWNGSPRESWRWFKKAANKGSGKAMANIAHCYENGYSGRKKNIKKAEYWKKKAREYGADNWI
jgi:TPR repeat protein